MSNEPAKFDPDAPTVFEIIKDWCELTGWDYNGTPGRMHPFALMHFENYKMRRYERWLNLRNSRQPPAMTINEARQEANEAEKD